MGSGTEDGASTAPRHALPFAAAILVLVTVSAVFSLNLWPFSSWDLFSGLRTDEQVGWAVVAVAPSGAESALRLVGVGAGTGGLGHLLADLDAEPVEARDPVCASWLSAARAQYGAAETAVRVYRLRWRLSDRRDRRAGPGSRALAWTCIDGGARVAP